ncbi:hypothetical protein SAMN05192552_100450 [Natrinema hispanicum]|uniref:Uncharacterized protein n=2 Tax=Natrinema hispanicum TaxID=392421 RepID=A0A1I0CPB5_9EURY|nr:hypothetical protein SAMN05192552_100450 [Natrinema hispanicum]SET21343.1 hypothetical protein SAMN04488694_104252 [Natrinema hispanicum]
MVLMPSLRSLLERLTDDRLRAATLIGLASIPITLVLALDAVPRDSAVIGGLSPATPLLAAGLFVGYYYHDRPIASRRAGVRTGLVGSGGVLAASVADLVTTLGSASPAMTAVTVGLFLVEFALGITFLVLLTMVSAIGGAWAANDLARVRHPTAPQAERERSVGDSWWWLPIVVYVLATPLVLLFVFWVVSDDGPGVIVAVLLLFCLVFTAIAAVVSLVKDTGTLADASAAWQPLSVVYVAGPVGVYALVYLVASLRQSIHPPGDAMYGFVVALWGTSLVYLINRHRYVGTP